MFTGLVLPNQILSPNNTYVFTFDHGRIFEYRSAEWVLENLRKRLSNYGYVVSVSRPIFSDRYSVVVMPSVSVSLENWLDAFDSSWKDMGYNNYTFIRAEEGEVTTQPGGLPQIIPSGAEVIGQTVQQAVSPFIPYVLLLGGIYLLFKVGIPEYQKVKIKRRRD
ncbi:MAG: hypothetical protein K6T87_16150 [Roseiflexus sp.]|uniref:hypothetical protein n=1 Tax=Roseiflexus sp. TaxID=2562120 RepID=UPI0025DBDBC1|nr:hypothetical protein [Roseiflexus sp.]MCL6542089.1 hypothetical protein [Roseiflexus sp.]